MDNKLEFTCYGVVFWFFAWPFSLVVFRAQVLPCPAFHQHLFFALLVLWKTLNVGPMKNKLNLRWCKSSLSNYTWSFWNSCRGSVLLLSFKNAFWFCREQEGGNISVAGFLKEVGAELEYRQRELFEWFSCSCLPTCRKVGFETQPRGGDARQ